MSEIRNSSGEIIDHTFHPGNRLDTLVILGHGVTGNKDRPLLVALAEGLSQKGWPCLRISWSGNGNAGGTFEDSCITKEVSDLLAVLDTVPEEVKVAYIGHSMGGAVGVITASVDPRISLLVTISGMVHTKAFVEREFGELEPGNGFMWGEEQCPYSQTFADDLNAIGNTLGAAAQVTQPWLLIHGTEDDVVPLEDSRDAHRAATSKKHLLEIEGAGHSFDETSYPLIIETVDAWLSDN